MEMIKEVRQQGLENPFHKAGKFIYEVATGRRKLFKQHPILDYYDSCEHALMLERQQQRKLYDPETIEGAARTTIEDAVMEVLIGSYIREGRVPRPAKCDFHQDKLTDPRVVAHRAVSLARRIGPIS